MRISGEVRVEEVGPALKPNTLSVLLSGIAERGDDTVPMTIEIRVPARLKNRFVENRTSFHLTLSNDE